MKTLFVLLCASLMSVSCISTASKTLKSVAALQVTRGKAKVVQVKLDKATKIYVDGAVKALEKEAHPDKETLLALRLLENTEDIIGVPDSASSLNVDLLLNAKPDVAETNKLKTIEKDHKELIGQRVVLDQQIQVIQNKITEDAVKLAQEHKSVLQRIKDSFHSYILITAIIVLLIFIGPWLFKLLFKAAI